MKKHYWPVLVAGALLACVVSCVAATSPNTSTTPTAWVQTMVAKSSLSSSVSSGTVPTAYLPYYTPFPFATVLNDSYSLGTLTAASSVSTLTRYMISASGAYCSIGTPSSSAETTLSFAGTHTTIKGVLSELVEAVSDSAVSGGFRLDSELHSLYSVDVNSSGNLVFQNVWGTATAPSGRGYLVFTYDGTTKLLQAKAHYSYNPSTYTRTLDSSFTTKDYYVKVTNATASLVASSANATQLTFYTSPVNVAIPTDFNPSATLYQSNSRVALTSTLVGTTIANMDSKVVQNLSSKYTAQVSAKGDVTATETAASTMLDTIMSHSTLRYPKKLYLAFRHGLLNSTLAADGVSNGTLGMNAVPYVYFTDEQDSAGTYHPFMCIANYSITDKPNRLVDVRRPPGDGVGDGYSSQKVTRDAVLELDLVKIPLKDYGLVTAVTENTLLATLLGEVSSSTDTASVYNYASTSGVGFTVDGSMLYPTLNNTLVTTQSNAEITSLGNHVGQGMGLHYHADGHIAMNNDLQLYNINDYKNQAHPPLIGFGLDGVALFGVYESVYPSMDGYSTELDSFGGHTHGTYGYHYHSHTMSATTTAGTSYTIDVLMKGAWKGLINSIPEFWDTAKKEPAYSMAQSHKYVGKP